METASSKHSHFTLPKRGVFKMQEVIFSKATDGHIAMLNHTMGRTVFVCEHSILPNMHQIAILKKTITLRFVILKPKSLESFTEAMLENVVLTV